MLQIFGARRIANLLQIGKLHSWFDFFNLEGLVMTNFCFIVRFNFVFDKFNFLGLVLLWASWSSEALVEMIVTLGYFVIE